MKGQKWAEVKAKLDPLNVKKGVFFGDDKFDIPIIRKQDVDIKKIVPFGNSDKDGWGHFYLDDFKFERVWNQPKRYINMVFDYDGIFSPDFSPYDDYPYILQAYNVYRNRWCGAFYQDLGQDVIPTVTWSGKRSFDFAFAGVEEGCTVSISTVGLWWQKKYLNLFDQGYEIMMEEIKPTKIIGYGKPIEGLEGDIEWFESFTEVNKDRLKGGTDAEG